MPVDRATSPILIDDDEEAPICMNKHSHKQVVLCRGMFMVLGFIGMLSFGLYIHITRVNNDKQ